MSKALLCLESPWESLGDDPKRQSVYPFLQGIERGLFDVSLYYSTFYERNGFELGLKDLVGVSERKQVLYIAAHGSEGRVAGLNAASIFSRLKICGDKLQGVLFGTCSFGNYLMNNKPKIFTQSRARWAFGYIHRVEWMTSTLMDIKILESVLDCDEPQSERAVIDCFSEALSPFNPFYELAEGCSLKESICLFVQRNGELVDITQRLIQALDWEVGEDAE